MENSILGIAKRGNFASDIYEKQLFEPRSPEYAGPIDSDQSEAAIQTPRGSKSADPRVLNPSKSFSEALRRLPSSYKMSTSCEKAKI